MTLSFPKELIFGGSEWVMPIRFDLCALNAKDQRTRRQFLVKENIISPIATVEFLTDEGDGVFAAYSVLANQV